MQIVLPQPLTFKCQMISTHEITFPLCPKRNRKWVKLKSYKERWGARWQKVTFTSISWHLKG